MDTMWISFALYWVNFGFWVYVMYKAWMTWYWGMMFMGICTCLIYGVPFLGSGGISELMIMGPTLAMTTLPVMVMGCAYSQSIIDTGVVESIVKKAIELGGERVFLTCAIITAIWVYVSFGTTMSGVVL